MNLSIREWRIGDKTALAQNLNNPKVLNNLRDGLPYPYTEKDAEVTMKEALIMNYPQPTHVGRGFCYAARRHEPAGIVYPAEQGMSTMPLSHRVTFGNTFLKMFAAPLMSALVTVPS